MVDWTTYGKVFGAESIAKGIERLGLEVDKKVKLGTGVAPHERASTYINLVGGILAPLVGDQMRVSPENQGYLEALGAHLLTEIWDYAEEYMPPAVPAGRRDQPQDKILVRINTPNYVPMSPPGSGMDGISVKAPVSDGGRYARG